MPNEEPISLFQNACPGHDPGSPEVIRLAEMVNVRFPLSRHKLEDFLHERGINLRHETVRFWWKRFGPMFAAEIRKRRADGLRTRTQWQWHSSAWFIPV